MMQSRAALLSRINDIAFCYRVDNPQKVLSEPTRLTWVRCSSAVAAALSDTAVRRAACQGVCMYGRVVIKRECSRTERILSRPALRDNDRYCRLRGIIVCKVLAWQSLAEHYL